MPNMFKPFHAFKNESITRTTLFKVGLWITIVSIVTAITSYLLVASKMEKQTLRQLENYIKERGQWENNIFALTQENHAQLKTTLIEQLQSSHFPKGATDKEKEAL